ncbi:MAG TPA: helix-turn-helix transcriptional regulator [Streptosporangiaceae bacterium]|nr:helix-turn-helix transcriptional regulator [Streptosporangiaceae bacterium]
MADKRAPSVRSRQLATVLRRLRDAATMTGEEAAGHLGWSPSKISRIETAQTAPSQGDLRRLLDLYDVTGTQRSRLELLGQTTGQRGWWDAYSDALGPEYTALIALEDEAESVRCYGVQNVPGLLQTERYAHEVARALAPFAPPGEIDRRVQVKMARQRVLTKERPLTLTGVIDEAMMLRMIGGQEVMAEQLEKLAEVGQRDNVNIQVLPLDIGSHPGLDGEFSIVSFADLIAPDVVYIEHMTSELYVENEAAVYRHVMAFDRLRTLALDITESAAVLKEKAGTLR